MQQLQDNNNTDVRRNLHFSHVISCFPVQGLITGLHVSRDRLVLWRAVVCFSFTILSLSNYLSHYLWVTFAWNSILRQRNLADKATMWPYRSCKFPWKTFRYLNCDFFPLFTCRTQNRNDEQYSVCMCEYMQVMLDAFLDVTITSNHSLTLKLTQRIPISLTLRQYLWESLTACRWDRNKD